METLLYPLAKDVLEQMDALLQMLGLTSQNGKPWRGYYNGKVNLSFTQAKDLTMRTHSPSNIERMLKTEISGDIWNKARVFVNNNPTVLHATSLVYHKNKKKISLQGYNPFPI